MMNEEGVMMALKAAGAIKENDHFVYTSGKHGSAYVNKDAVYPDTDRISKICNEFAKIFVADRVDAVIGPALGGIILSQWTAQHLTVNLQSRVLSLYAEKDGKGGFEIKRGQDQLIKGKRVLVVEDVLTTGGSVKKVIAAVRACGGYSIGLGVLCNRGNITATDVDIPKLVALTKVSLLAWSEEECPLCAKGIPVNTNVGKGAEFLARK